MAIGWGEVQQRDVERRVVAHDELDFAPGVVKMKRGGGIAGHNGLRDISSRLGTHDYWRLRLGVGHPGDRNAVVDYVLNKPSPDDRTLIDAAIDLPGNGDCRLRLLNADPTRIMDVAVDGAEAAVLAIDGIAVPPFALEAWPLGPGMRLDLLVRAPSGGASARLVDRRAPESPTLARLVGSGPDGKARPFDPLPLRASRIPEPDLAAADELAFTFAAGDVASADDPLAADLLGSLCLASEEYWTINGKSWPGRDHQRLPPPLARLERDRSYVFTLKNATQLLHPIHVHGHSFKVLGSNRRSLPVHHVDTMLLLPDEEVRVAFVADNPGKWMFHCHVIEHQEAGMMAYVEVA